MALYKISIEDTTPETAEKVKSLEVEGLGVVEASRQFELQACSEEQAKERLLANIPDAEIISIEAV